MERCHYCGCELVQQQYLGTPFPRQGPDGKGFFTMDHKIPSCRGGTGDHKNLVECCSQYNTQKGGKTHDEYVFWRFMNSIFGPVGPLGIRGSLCDLAAWRKENGVKLPWWIRGGARNTSGKMLWEIHASHLPPGASSGR